MTSQTAHQPQSRDQSDGHSHGQSHCQSHGQTQGTSQGKSDVQRLLELARRPYYFVHITKCGGSSVEAALDLFKFHATAQYWRNMVGQGTWDALRTFSIVRNPYDRVCSMYRYRLKQGSLPGADLDMGLNDWVYHTLERQDPEFWSHSNMLSPCADWVTDEDGSLMVKTVIRLEQLQKEWWRVQQITRSAVELPHTNVTAVTADNGVEALSADSLATITQFFARDFELFGYERRS